MWMRRDVLQVCYPCFVLLISCPTSCVLQLVFLLFFVVIHSCIFALPIGAFICLTFLVDACSAVVDMVLVFAIGEALGLVVGTFVFSFLCFSFLLLPHFLVSLLCRMFRCVPECWPVIVCPMGGKSATGFVPGECVCVICFDVQCIVL